ncbi:hypothetical protein LCGC14_1326450 [marine sediment metagenome]|uniref:Uncharacterized protein n=1 Tax=marine sediment metagenome TaxID=412755 RepID=A0A0F9MZ01_9ZZZZ
MPLSGIWLRDASALKYFDSILTAFFTYHSLSASFNILIRLMAALLSPKV